AEHVARGPQVTEGPQTTRDEKLKARSEERYNQEMMKLYKKHVLQQKEVDLVQIQSLGGNGKRKEESERELVGTSGD
ncbi:MAG: hypothetical protein HY649_07525, partial [Acidobacteria bacterium]|nr:hypothetical protein [Acidobacteriota bacterium]